MSWREKHYSSQELHDLMRHIIGVLIQECILPFLRLYINKVAIPHHSKITTEELASLSGKGLRTIKRHIAKMPHIVYVGSGYSGHLEVKKKQE